MALQGHSRGLSKGGRPGMGGGSGFSPRPSKPATSFSKPAMSFSKPIKTSSMPSPVAFGAPVQPSPVIINNFGSKPMRRSGGLFNSLVSSAASAAVGVASAAIVNKIHENSQMKLQQKQAEQQAEMARQQAEQQAMLARQQAEYQVEIERLKAQQEEIKKDVIQDKRYYANCPYCMGVNNGGKFCQYCGSSLAYYDEDEENGNVQGAEAKQA